MIDTTAIPVPSGRPVPWLTASEVALAIGASARWVRDAALVLPASRSRFGTLRIDGRHIAAYRAAWASANGNVEVR